MFLHNLKVALRNLMKYKIQTLISIVSIAIGIVTLAFAIALMTNYRLPSIYDQPYRDRIYTVAFLSADDEKKFVEVGSEILLAVKRDGGLRCAEKVVFVNGLLAWYPTEFHLIDSTQRKGMMELQILDPEYPEYTGLRSAITGKRIGKLKGGEAIMSKSIADKFFNGANPSGAVQTLTGDVQTKPVTVVDIFEPVSRYEEIVSNEAMLFSLDDSIEATAQNNTLYGSSINVVLKEGFTESQLIQELNQRLEPFGAKAEVTKALEDSKIMRVIGLRLIVWLSGALILLAATIGFLRMQTQLFRIRRRELSLRIVNGAKSKQLFLLLTTEVFITLCLSIILAIFGGIMLQDYINNRLSVQFSSLRIFVPDLWKISCIIGIVLLAICCAIAILTIKHICKSDGSGLSSSIRRSHSHLMRNVMLGVQLAISIIFVGSTFILIKAGDIVLNTCNVPENDSFYKGCMNFNPFDAVEPARLIDEISRLPDLDKMYANYDFFFMVNEVAENPDIQQYFPDGPYFRSYNVNDTSIISFFRLDVDWFKRDVDRNESILIREDLYEKFKEHGLGDKTTLTLQTLRGEELQPLPIAGTFANLPYDAGNKPLIIFRRPVMERQYLNYILVPKPGRSKALAKSVNETIMRLEPTVANPMAVNFREYSNNMIGMVETVRVGGWILAIVSLIICGMSIFSTIALDTRARSKEVAIRKVNGAKKKDIYRLFGKIYLILLAVASAIAIPVCVIANRILRGLTEKFNPDQTLSPVVPIIGGIAVVLLLVGLIISWQIYKVMLIDPAKVIAKE